MKINMMKAVVAILVISLGVSACGGLTLSEPKATPLPSATPTPLPTETSTPTKTPPEFYAGFTQNSNIPFLLVDRSGESLGAISDPDGSNVKGVVWVSADQKLSMVIYSDNNGLPQRAVVGDEVILYSNYTKETVDLTIIHSDGSQELFHTKRDTDTLNKVTSFLTPPSRLASYSMSIPLLPEQVDTLTLLKGIVTIVGAATCVFAVLGGPVTLTILGTVCAGTIITGIITYGKMLGLNVAGLEDFGYGASIALCLPGLQAGACLTTILTTLQKIKQMADQKIDLLATGHGMQQGQIQDWTFSNTSTPSPTNTPQPASSLRGTVTEVSNCRYGPDWPYLYEYGLRAGTPMEVIGRDLDGDWLKTQAIGGNKPCWIKAAQMQVNGDVMILPDAYPYTQGLPISPFFPQIVLQGVSGSGGTVNVSWQGHDIRSDLQTGERSEYIVEIWTCVSGKPTFYALGFEPLATDASFKIDNSCGMTPHADVIGEDKEGFSPPTQIALP